MQHWGCVRHNGSWATPPFITDSDLPGSEASGHSHSLHRHSLGLLRLDKWIIHFKPTPRPPLKKTCFINNNKKLNVIPSSSNTFVFKYVE